MAPPTAADERRIDQGSIATYTSEATQLRMAWDRAHQKLNVIDELKRLSVAGLSPETGPRLEGTWRQLSGYEHGLGWAAMSGSSRKVTARVPGGADVLLVIDDAAFVNAAKTAYLLLITACRTFRRRHTEPTKP
jgi:hypothetical protein